MIELWEAAKRANLSDDELDSLKVARTSLVTVYGPFTSFCFIAVLQSQRYDKYYLCIVSRKASSAHYSYRTLRTLPSRYGLLSLFVHNPPR